MQQLDDIYRTQAEVGKETVDQAVEMARSKENAETMQNDIERATGIVIGAIEVLKKY